MKRFIAILGIFLTVMAGTGIGANAASVVGSCGDDTRWSVDDSGNLEIFGVGDMWNFSDTTLPPWTEYKEEFPIKNIVIRNGVTNIGDYSFYDCNRLNKVLIFSSVTHIGANIFNEYNHVASVVCDGTIADWQKIVIEKPNDELLSSNIFPNSAYIYGNGDGICCFRNTPTTRVACGSL